MTYPLPTSPTEMARLGWDQLDILLVTGDAYVDHPAFGTALLGRWLVSHGYRTGIVAQPRWDTGATDVAAMGRPRLFAGVTAGALDSMLAHYTAFRKKRSDDAYTPGGRSGARPNRATIVYTNLLRRAFRGLPIVAGGIEASLRRAAHYDFWSDAVRRSILLDSKADLVVYGMGERAIIDIARRLSANGTGDARQGVATPCLISSQALSAKETGGAREALAGIPGTAFVGEVPSGTECASLPSYEDIKDDPAKLMDATLALERQVHDGASWAVQSSGGRDVVFAPPAAPLTTEELDALYGLPYTRRAHPSYGEAIPALSMIQFSITVHRGCGGGCSFCSLALHQGRRIRSRSAEGILAEAKRLTRHPDWKGTLTDVGGPSANMWGTTCAVKARDCRRASCLYPSPCPDFRADQTAMAELISAVARVPGIAHVRIASGVRHDLALTDPVYTSALVGQFTGGQLKLAPEHSSANVLGLMRKPGFDAFLEFLTVFERESRRAGKEQYVVPYLMSAFPGCTEDDMRQLARWFKSKGWKPRQVQCFIPTPGTVATAMYVGGIDSAGKAIYVARGDAERLRQHRILCPPPERLPRGPAK